MCSGDRAVASFIESNDAVPELVFELEPYNKQGSVYLLTAGVSNPLQ